MPTSKAAASPAAQLRGFMDKYSPEVAATARAVLTWMRARLPGAIEMVYDNYNFLVIGFSPTERPSEAVFSIVLAPRWVTLCFLHGARLDDPEKLLRGGGKRVRNIRLESGVKTLKQPAVGKLIDQALSRSPVQFDDTQKRQLVIRAVVAKQRPRRP
jgi:Domain of unknown function (DU1801)